jgi:hypothetical protein
VGTGEVNPDALNESQLRTMQMMHLYEDCVAASSWQPVEELVRRKFAGAHWVLSCLLVIELASSPQFVPLFPNLTSHDQQRAMWVPSMSLNLPIDAQGNPLSLSADGEFLGVVEGAYGYGFGGWPDIVANAAHVCAEQLNFLFKLALFAIGLMHCKNVQVREAEQPAKWRKAYARRHHHAALTYKVIHVPQFSEVMDVHGRLRAVVANSPYRLHQVRGHYKTYTQEAPLFGKITGRFFWSEQFRGQQSEGVIKHRYEINQLPSRQS